MHPRQPNSAARTQGSRSSGRTWVAIVVVTIILGVVSAVSARVWLAARASTGQALASAHRGQPAPAQSATEQVEAELITVRRFGFEPAAIKRPAGEVVFVIDNRSQQQELALTLSRVQGNGPTIRVKDVRLLKGQVNWLERFNLPPGDYVLTEASRPAWVCNITLTSH